MVLDFAVVGMGTEEKRDLVDRLRQAWEFNQVKIPLPPAFSQNE
jgi:hypothetical protein